MRAARVYLVSCCIGVASLTPGCFLDRSGLGDAEDAGEAPDGGGADAAAEDAFVPLDTGPCAAGRPELCNGADDDCDPTTADGADEATLGAACDDPADADACEDGRIACIGGALVCAGDDGDQPDEVELCNGLDDDCNPDTPDGADETAFGDPCDDPADADLCLGGTLTCAGSGLVCTGDDGDQPSEVERCNGIDDDCNPDTLDGASEPTLGDPCDSPSDTDLCADGTIACTSTTLVCLDDGDQPDEVELCNGLDDDCNPATPDGAGDPRVGGACDGSDSDMCADGTGSCSAGVFSCSDDAASATETCNGRDDDCDGQIDNAAGCPCYPRLRGNHAYIICGDFGDRRTWTEARDWCRGRGYELVTIDDAAENAWLDMQLDGIDGDREYWIGANDRTTEMSWRWVAGDRAVTYTNWNGGEPNNNGFAGGEEDCAEFQPYSSGATRGGWNDSGCGNDRRFVCEAGP